jgi:alcohol dehydrogenase (cytochrome c)
METIMSGLKHAAALAAVFALCTVAGTAGSEEIQGQKGMNGTPIWKTVNVSQPQLNNADKQANNWLHTNGGYAQTRFSPGKQINTTNVKELANGGSNSVSVIDTVQNVKLRDVAVGKLPWGVVIK